MKNSIKKVLCTAVAAVSLSTLVTVPSSLNKPNSDNAIVNVMEAEAETTKHYLTLKCYDKLTFDVCNNISKLNGRTKPDGPTAYTFYSYNINSIKLCKILIEKYGDENRVWGLTEGTYPYKNPNTGKTEYIQVWVCIYRGIKNGNYYELKEQLECKQSKYSNKLKEYFKKGASNPAYFWEGDNANKNTLYCYSQGANSYVVLEK